MTSRAKRKPRLKSNAGIERIIVVAEKVAARWPHPEGSEQSADVDDETRTVTPAHRRPQGLWEKDRSKQHAAVLKWIVPIAVDINVAARRPNVVRGGPRPSSPASKPV